MNISDSDANIHVCIQARRVCRDLWDLVDSTVSFKQLFSIVLSTVMPAGIMTDLHAQLKHAFLTQICMFAFCIILIHKLTESMCVECRLMPAL